MSIYTWSYNLTVNGNKSAVFSVTTSTQLVSSGYAVIAVTGTFGGQNITGIVAANGFDSNSERLGTAAASYFDGIDHLGLAFTTAANSIDIYSINAGMSSAALLVDEGTSSNATSVLNGAPVVVNSFSTTACFVTGTRIATTAGMRPVEGLRAGEMVVTAAGVARAIRWIGHRRVDCAAHPHGDDVMPVRVVAGAFGAGVPVRDLLLSPDHAVFADGVLIPVRYLINDATVSQDAADVVTYWHVELDTHDVLLAEGLAVESYLDSGNRASFDNAGVTRLHACFASRDRAAWASRGCAVLVESGPVLERVRARLAGLARGLVPPAVTVVIAAPGVVRAVLPAGTTRVHLVSACARALGEHRRLGAAIAGIRVGGDVVALDGAGLAGGFHAVEPGWRWTHGEGVLLVPALGCDTPIEIDVAMVAGWEAA